MTGVAMRTLEAMIASGHPSTPEELIPAFRGDAPSVAEVVAAMDELRGLGYARERQGRWRTTARGTDARNLLNGGAK